MEKEIEFTKRIIENDIEYAEKMLEITTEERIKAYFQGYLEALKTIYNRFN